MKIWNAMLQNKNILCATQKVLKGSICILFAEAWVETVRMSLLCADVVSNA